MGNVMGKKKRKLARGLSAKGPSAKGPSTKHNVDLSHVVPMTSSNLQNIVVEFPKEIEEDLERRKVESYKALAAQGSKRPARTSSAPVPPGDTGQTFYDKAKGLDVPAVMVPKPWSEVDQILSKLKTDSPSPSPVPHKSAAAAKLETQQPETIDMSELMDDLDELDEDETKTPKKNAEIVEPLTEPATPEVLTPEPVTPGVLAPQPDTPVVLTPRPIRSLEASLSFSTIHTVEEVEGGDAKPETVISIMKAHSALKAPQRGRKSESAAHAPATPRKVNVNPRLLARMEAFM